MNGKERITDCPAVNTGQWYHIGVSWRSWDGDWRVYINGKPSDGGKGLSVGTTIPGVVLSSAWTLSSNALFFLGKCLWVYCKVVNPGAACVLQAAGLSFWVRTKIREVRASTLLNLLSAPSVSSTSGIVFSLHNR